MKRFWMAVAAAGLLFTGIGTAEAGHGIVGGVPSRVGHGHAASYGYYGYYGGYGGYGGNRHFSFYGGHGAGRGGDWRRPHRHWHDTSHYDYHPAEVVPHYNHYHYVPSHWDYHQEGHWDHH